MSVKPALDEFQDLSHQGVGEFSAAILRFASAVVRGDSVAEGRALRGLTRLSGETMALADLLGRRRLFLEVDASGSSDFLAVDTSPSTTITRVPVAVPAVPFQEALEDLVTREPRLATSAEAVAELYRTRHAFAMARSAEIEVTKRVKEAFDRLVKRGKSATTIENMIEELGPFSRSYAQTVYRTNLNTAFTAGRFRQVLEDPAVEFAVPAFEFQAVLDSDVRETHAAAHGLVAGVGDSIWGRFAPPLDYQCRCSVRMVDRFELRRRNLLDEKNRVRRLLPSGFSRARPGVNFGVRPDRRIYG